MPLFEDPRVAWGLEALGGVSGQRALELGPMEGGHSYMLQRGGAREVVSIEGNQRCYLKCLVVKEVAGLDRVRYELGDFVEFMRATPERFDLCLASGVLYHMADPLEVVHLVSRVADRAFFWTHYHDDRVMQTASAPHFSGAHELRHGGFACTGHRYEVQPRQPVREVCGRARQPRPLAAARGPAAAARPRRLHARRIGFDDVAARARAVLRAGVLEGIGEGVRRGTRLQPGSCPRSGGSAKRDSRPPGSRPKARGLGPWQGPDSPSPCATSA